MYRSNILGLCRDYRVYIGVIYWGYIGTIGYI